MKRDSGTVQWRIELRVNVVLSLSHWECFTFATAEHLECGSLLNGKKIMFNRFVMMSRFEHCAPKMQSARVYVLHFSPVNLHRLKFCTRHVESVRKKSYNACIKRNKIKNLNGICIRSRLYDFTKVRFEEVTSRYPRVYGKWALAT